MRIKGFGIIAIIAILTAISVYGQDVIVPIVPSDGTAATMINAQIVADTVAAGGLLATHVYEFARDQYYLQNATLTIPPGRTLRLRAAAGAGAKPIIYLWETGAGANPTRPPGNSVILNGSNLIAENICIAGIYEPIPETIDQVQGGLINTTGAGASIILDGVIFNNINGQHVRTGFNTVKVQATNCIFANMGALTTSNFGAGKGFDLRDVACDSFIVVNTTFVNFQDRAIRHYNFANPTAGTGLINYGRIEHNTFINGMGFHGLLSLGSVGPEIIIANNLFVDAFALGEDSTDATRQAEWANTGEFYSNGSNKIQWIFTAPNETTQWTVENNFYTIGDSGWAFLNDFGFPVGDQLSAHITGRLGAAAADAFTYEEGLKLVNTPNLMTNLMRWYEDPLGGHKAKDQTNFVKARDDYDRRLMEFYRDSLDASYPATALAYTGADMGFPVGDLNWFPDMKAIWEAGGVPVPPLEITIDGTKDEFYTQLTGPDDGFLQIKSYAFNDNGIPKGGDADLSANVWTAWDEQYLYLYEEVMDDTISGLGALQAWESYVTDGLELKFDPQPTDSVTNSVVGLALTAQSTGPQITSDSLNAVPDSMKQWKRKLIPGGYALEMAVDWRAIYSGAETITPAEGNIFGMAICQHDNDGIVAAPRQASVTWASSMLDAVWNQPKYHGTVKFLADHKLQFIPTNNITGQTNDIPYDGTPFYLRIDGLRDPFYYSLTGPADGYLQLRSYAYNNNGKPKDDADLSAKMWTAWDDTWFYLYEEVKDDTISMSNVNAYNNDGFELKIDPVATDSVLNSINGNVNMTAKYTTGVAGEANGTADSLGLMKKYRKLTTGGYVIEFAVKWSALSSGTGAALENVNVGVDNIFGAALQNHDNDNVSATGTRTSSVQWAAVLRDQVWNTPKYCGTVKFLADNKLNYDAKNAMTGVATIIPYDGSDFTGVEGTEQVQLPKEFSLKQNYPNPFNPTTTISFSVPTASHVRLSVFDMMGREVAVLVNEKMNPGFYKATFDGKQMASGIYFYRMEADSKVMKQKMVLVK